MLYVVLLSFGLILVSFLLLGIKVFFVKDGHFPDTHVGNNKVLRERGIHCVKAQDRQEQNRKDLFDLSKL
jgi:hypothetical protein